MPTASAVGDRLRVTVTAANLAGSASATSAPSAPVSTDPPQIVSPPTASGLAQAGATLTASTGTWSSAAALSYEYQWKRCDATGANCSAVAGSSGTNYLLGAADVQSTVRVVVTATNDAGSATAMSDPSPVVTALPAAPQLLSTPALSRCSDALPTLRVDRDVVERRRSVICLPVAELRHDRVGVRGHCRRDGTVVLDDCRGRGQHTPRGGDRDKLRRLRVGDLSAVQRRAASAAAIGDATVGLRDAAGRSYA